MVLALFTTLILFAFQPFVPVSSQGPTTVFELELPDFQLSTTQTEITVPSSSVSRLMLHVLNPAADNIDYGTIRTIINGRAAGTISEVSAGVRGKIVKLDLHRLPGFQFFNGRNTVEISAENRRGRKYYSSFVIKTATEDWNDEFTYRVFPSPIAKHEVPPQVLLVEPDRAVNLPPTMSGTTVNVKGIATATTTIVRVSVDGNNLPFKAVSETKTRELTRLPKAQGVAFETTIKVKTNTRQILIEAEDKLGSRTQVLVPVLSRNLRPTRIAGQKYALIIGVSRYLNNGKGIDNLEFADADARAIYDFLQEPEAGRFSRENMLLLANEEATTVRIHEALTSFVARAEANDVLLIFFAGHGAPDPRAQQNLYIITHDTSVADMPHTAISMHELRRYIDSNVKSKQLILLLDACHSAGVSTEGVRTLTNNLSHLYLRTLLYEEKGRAIITSSDVNELSNESTKWGRGHGVFTYYLLEGLKGDADINSDRLVSVGELFRYVRQKVQFDTERRQNPRMLMGDNENLALSVVTR